MSKTNPKLDLPDVHGRKNGVALWPLAARAETGRHGPYGPALKYFFVIPSPKKSNIP
jgi:hypothetical protein